jgi:hypothetical protein
MITDREGAILCYKSYFQTDYFDKTVQVDQVMAYVKYLPDETVVVFPGSRTETDWIRDAASLKQITHPILGLVAFGFCIGIDDLFKALFPLLAAKKLRLLGHSLGGPRAYYLGALLVKQNVDPMAFEIVTYESPRPGGQQLKEILAPVTMRAYLNGDDIVPHVPENGMQPTPLIPISSQAPFDLVGKYHHIQSVITSLNLLEFGGFNGKPSS